MDMLTPERALEMFKPLVEGNGQAIPMLMYCADDGPIVLALAEVERGGMQETLDKVLTFAEHEFGKPKWLVLSAEAYSHLAKQLPDGTLEVTDEAPPMDVVSITAVSPSEGWCSFTGFARLGDGTIHWHETNVVEPMGGIADLLMARLR